MRAVFAWASHPLTRPGVLLAATGNFIQKLVRQFAGLRRLGLNSLYLLLCQKYLLLLDNSSTACGVKGDGTNVSSQPACILSGMG